jgi:hypothetical protein
MRPRESPGAAVRGRRGSKGGRPGCWRHWGTWCAPAWLAARTERARAAPPEALTSAATALLRSPGDVGAAEVAATPLCTH